MVEFEHKRGQMVKRQIEGRGVCDRYVLEAMREVPREEFVSAEMAEFAYEDRPLPIEEGQTISQPYIVAAMIEAAKIRPGESVLEVGAGSGYAAAVMSCVADHVRAIERHPALGEGARERFDRLGYDNIELHIGDGTKGWPQAASFDAILVAAGSPRIPEALIEQLAVDGRIVIPVGEDHPQRLLRVTRTDQGLVREEDLGPVNFVPLVGEQGWK